MPNTLSLKTVHEAVLSHGAAFRLRSRLQPAGGPGDKVFPATYAASNEKGSKHATKYATEERFIEGEKKPTVLLDSVASQANRMELALLESHRQGLIRLPVLAIDFEAEIPDLGRLSSLEVPHRVYDAIFRDSTLDGEAFRASKLGRSLTDASPTDARAMLASCPTALVFGAWDSTGPRGGMGNKFQRSLVSEVVGIDFVAGTSVGSRMDPLQIAASVPVQAPKGEKSQWTIAKKGKQRPSEINHSTIAPNRNTEAGGVTFAYALHTAVLSLPALRRLRFGNWDGTKSDAARTLLAALGILALVLQRRCGYDFRSRCALVPEGPSPIELVAADGTVTAVEASVDQAVAVFKQAVAAAKKAGVTWSDGDVLLQPMPKLVQLILASREAHRVGPVET